MDYWQKKKATGAFLKLIGGLTNVWLKEIYYFQQKQSSK